MNQAITPKIPVIEWKVSKEQVGYPEAMEFMENRVAEIIAGNAPECIWLLEHPPIYTSGTSAKPEDLLTPSRFPVYATGRGGQFTYHGPGMRIAYVMLDLKKRYEDTPDIRHFVCRLEQWIINSIAEFGAKGERRSGRVGIWVVSPEGREEKIAALGIRIRRGVSFHGIAINVCPNLEHFQGIVPCGLHQYGVTSLQKMGRNATIPLLDDVLKQQFEAIFQSTEANPLLLKK